MKDSGTSGYEKELSFDLPVENELLMLKLNAEFGAECIPGNVDIPPEVINEFLKSVYAFEHKFRECSEMISIYDKIGRPPFRKEQELSDRALAEELARIRKLLRRHRLQLDVQGDYPPRVIYRFITEEFFVHRIAHLDLPGYISHFCYEDFHPDHEADIRRCLLGFLFSWFSRSPDATGRQLAEAVALPDGRHFNRKEVLQRICNLFDAFPSFENCQYKIDQLSFNGDKDGKPDEATVEGAVQYEATMESGERMHVEGPLRLCLSASEQGWEICYFELAGFSWDG